MKALLSVVDINTLEQNISELKREQLVKSKNKQTEVPVVDRKALQELMTKSLGDGLTEEFFDKISPIVQLNPKFNHIYQYKHLVLLIREVHARISEGVQMQETNDGAQVVSFKQLESDEESTGQK